MTLGQKQRLFTFYIAKLILRAYEMGYEMTLGDAYRHPLQAAENAKPGPNGEKPKGISNSLHCQRLAIDLNLFRHGEYLTTTEAHRPLGEYWESLHELARWGGRFNDGNHYSFEHEGRK